MGVATVYKFHMTLIFQIPGAIYLASFSLLFLPRPSRPATMVSSESPKGLLDDKPSPNEVPIPILQMGATESEDDEDNSEFGGKQERQEIERKLLWKLDCRMSIMIVIYILNYVRLLRPIFSRAFATHSYLRASD